MAQAEKTEFWNANPAVMTTFRKTFFELQAQTSPHPLGLEIERAEGLYIFDRQGRKYMDMVAGLAVTNIGHRHPKIVEAIKKQADTHLHITPYGEFIQRPQIILAEKLASILPANLNCSYFVNSGTEANEGAVKLAKRVTGRRKVIAFHKSYHGSTHGSLSFSGNEKKKSAFRPLLPEVYFLKFNSEEDLELIDNETACVIMETIQGDAGVRIPSHSFMKKLRDKCSKTGALLILDEIQTGFGRTGKMFAFEHYHIVPDILTLAKALGGGMPIGAFISSKEIMAKLSYDPMLGHITTFGGHPVSCAAAAANIGVLLDEKLIEPVEQKGALLQELLDHPKINEIRRIGLMLALEFDSRETVEKIVKGCMENGVICFWFLSCPESFRLSPPLTISEEEMEIAALVIKQEIESHT